MTDFSIALGNRIKELRKKKGFSQERLSEKADISSKYLGEIERGKVNISTLVLYNLATALEVSVSDLVQSEQEKINFEKEVETFIKKATPEQIQKMYVFIKSIL
ncbi:helix-turn-helix domain-containing protein [Geovibrio ferrireducens]|uniref:helix-turn-helix domain-containing protein n=1 Tax=Geovibrio ferrireducens TaxID=46201 RepID=UPI0022461EDC|nr:helix-turn-helix transcriptional regulator [Geovibrio ferrireducens]